MAAAKATVDHEAIRKWVEDRGGSPAAVKGTGGDDDPGILRVDFPGYSGEGTLEHIEWDDFFAAFQDNELAFLYQDEKNSRFNKLVSRDSVDVERSPSESKGDGKTKQTHAVRLLERQHRQVEALFERYFEGETVEEKEQTFAELADALAAHSKIEETIFYPEVLDDETEDLLEEAVNEHLEVKRMLAEMLDEEIDEDFDVRMNDLQSAVEHHVEEEEQRLFKMLGDVPRDSFMEMGQRMKAYYDELLAEEPRFEVPSETQAPAPLT